VDKKSSKTKSFLLNLFLPKFCLGCKKEGSYLCDDCRALLDISEFNYCLCEAQGLPKRFISSREHQFTMKCQNCSNKTLSGLYFALSYKEKSLARKLIHQFKYEPYLKDLSETLASVLIEHFVLTGKNKNEIWENSALIPVPLDNKKIKSRGYNQSEELAKELAKVLKVPVLTDVLMKIKITESQMGLNKEQRAKNLQGAFTITNAPLLQGKKIFLIDDVYTTGSTLEECARVLRNAGAKQIWGITIAREG